LWNFNQSFGVSPPPPPKQKNQNLIGIGKSQLGFGINSLEKTFKDFGFFPKNWNWNWKKNWDFAKKIKN
jgi:hypothetical protein